MLLSEIAMAESALCEKAARFHRREISWYTCGCEFHMLTGSRRDNALREVLGLEVRDEEVG